MTEVLKNAIHAMGLFFMFAVIRQVCRFSERLQEFSFDAKTVADAAVFIGHSSEPVFNRSLM